MPDVLVWRIGSDTPTYTADDAGGRGAELTGGRWNRVGTPLLYTSSSRALACLETVVHLAGGVPLPLNRYLVEVSIPDAVWNARTVFTSAGIGWDAEPAGKVSLDWGSQWAASASSLVAEVPSVVVPEESNVLINPLHPDRGELGIRKLRRWTYDFRLVVR